MANKERPKKKLKVRKFNLFCDFMVWASSFTCFAMALKNGMRLIAFCAFLMLVFHTFTENEKDIELAKAK